MEFALGNAALAVWLPPAVKMTATAGFVVAATWAAERSGPLVGAMVATLPIAAGPAYVLVAFDHDASFIAASARASLAANAANAVFCLVHARLAQSRRMPMNLGAAMGIWAVSAVVIRSVAWTLPAAVVLNAVVFGICLPAARSYRTVAAPRLPRTWYGGPLRAGLVAGLAGLIVMVSGRVGPMTTGVLALFPVVLVTLVLILQPRIGGPAAGALTANATTGLVGYGLALVALCLAAVPLGTTAGLLLALAVAVGWNAAVLLYRRRPICRSRPV